MIQMIDLNYVLALDALTDTKLCIYLAWKAVLEKDI